jgi:sterol desaturase/sphingolipid hydroxylase (fatty acid hydroxylase superfamily)
MDLTVIAIPGFFGSMAYESWWLRQRAEREGPSPVDYERNDTIASLTMGTGSLVIPLLTSRLSRNFELGRGRWARPLLTVGLAAAAATAVADAVARSAEREAGSLQPIGSGADELIDTATPTGATPTGDVASVDPAPVAETRAARMSRWARRVGGSTAVAAIAATGITAASTWAARTSAQRLFQKRVLPDLGGGPLALGVAVLGWDFIYYWNHRIQHESRFLWAIHVVHHSSERYNLSTALRQPWAESLGMFVPYGVMAWLGVRPNLIETARQINLLYQFWIHTDAVRRIGPLEEVLNTPSHHRAHHGSNRRYLDRNHGSILIVWDRLFGTFQRELDDDPVVYGLTKNIETFNPLRVATHEYADIVSDVAGARTWSDRLSFVLRGPGWAYERRPGRPGGEAAPIEATSSAA